MELTDKDKRVIVQSAIERSAIFRRQRIMILVFTKTHPPMENKIDKAEFFEQSKQMTVVWHKQEKGWAITVYKHAAQSFTWNSYGHLPSIENALYFINNYDKKFPNGKQD